MDFSKMSVEDISTMTIDQVEQYKAFLVQKIKDQKQEKFDKVLRLLDEASELVPVQTRNFVCEFEKSVKATLPEGKQEEVKKPTRVPVKKPTRVPAKKPTRVLVKKAALLNLEVRENTSGIYTFKKKGRLFSYKPWNRNVYVKTFDGWRFAYDCEAKHLAFKTIPCKYGSSCTNKYCGFKHHEHDTAFDFDAIEEYIRVTFNLD